jgi:biopolymer transport protein ExbD
MAMSVGRRGSGAIADINVTPMADVMIVLLIIFMVATPLFGRPPVQLPEASHPTPKEGERLEITLRRDGVVTLDGTPLAGASALAEYLAARTSDPGTLRVVIQADRDATYAAIAPVLAACREARVGEVALAAALRPGS